MFDLVHMLVYFIYAQRRLPRRNSGLLNDYLFFLKAGPELADALRQITSDKVYAKYFIDEVAGARVTPETYAVFHSVDRIRRRDLPERCVLKPSHASGTIVYLDGPDQEIGEDEREALRQALARDIYAETREINYKYLPKRILCEELIQARDEIKDYKLFCYKGRVRFTQVDWDRHGLHKQNFYDAEWNPIHVTYNRNPTGAWEPLPENYARMCELAERIARHFEWVRVDLYIRDGRIFVGELTHCHNQANGVFGSLEEERRISRIFFGEAPRDDARVAPRAPASVKDPDPEAPPAC